MLEYYFFLSDSWWIVCAIYDFLHHLFIAPSTLPFMSEEVRKLICSWTLVFQELKHSTLCLIITPPLVISLMSDGKICLEYDGLSGAIKLSKMSMKMSSSKKQSKNKKIGVDLRGLKCLLRYDDKTYDQLVKVRNAEVTVQTEAIEGRPTSLAILVSKLLASKLIKLQPVKRRQKALLIRMSKLMV